MMFQQMNMNCGKNNKKTERKQSAMKGVKNIHHHQYRE